MGYLFYSGNDFEYGGIMGFYVVLSGLVLFALVVLAIVLRQDRKEKHLPKKV